MVRPPVARRCVQCLLDIASNDADRRCREAALTAVVSLPLSTSSADEVADLLLDLFDSDGTGVPRATLIAAAGRFAAGRVDEALRRLAEDPGAPDGPLARRALTDPLRRDPPVPAPQTTARVPLADALELADLVRRSLPGNRDLPGRLDALRWLPADEARRLLSDLLARIATEPVNDRDLAARTRRVEAAYRGLTGDGYRPVVADLPARVPRDRLDRPAWLGGLLTMVDPTQVVVAACEQADTADPAVRRTALTRLSKAGWFLARPPRPLPAPSSADEALAALARLLGPAILLPRPVRGEAPQPPAGGDQWSGPGVSAGETRAAYPLLEVPERVPPEEVFELRVGLAGTSAREAEDVALAVPVSSFTLRIDVRAPGFTVKGGASLRRELSVDAGDPYPYDVLRLAASADPRFGESRPVTAIYYVDGVFVGVATRAVTVGAPAAARMVAAAPRAARPEADWILFPDPATQPDLTLVLVEGDGVDGSDVEWTFQSPHPSVGRSTEPVPGRLGDATASWLKRVTRGIEDRRSSDLLGAYVRGVAAMVADAVPDPVWAALDRAGGLNPAPSVLLATADPYVPWELARVPRPWNPDGAPYLGAQAVVGRWPYRVQARTPAPVPGIAARSMAAVCAEYGGAVRLPQAEQEAAHLSKEYGAAPVAGLGPAVLRCLGGDPPGDIVHFAMHGKVDPGGTQDGLLMADGRWLDPAEVRGVERARARLVFLNACQVGQGEEMLGDYAGLAAAFLSGGAQAVVAPLWKVDDEVARTFAEGFYAAVLRDGMAPAEYLRRQRLSVRDEAGSILAYLFFGHPLMRVEWSGSS